MTTVFSIPFACGCTICCCVCVWGEWNAFTGSIFQVIDSEINSAVIPKCFPCVWGRVIIVRSPGNLARLYACHTGIKGRGRGRTGTGGPVALEGTDRRELRLQGLQHNGHIQLWKKFFQTPLKLWTISGKIPMKYVWMNHVDLIERGSGVGQTSSVSLFVF